MDPQEAFLLPGSQLQGRETERPQGPTLSEARRGVRPGGRRLPGLVSKGNKVSRSEAGRGSGKWLSRVVNLETGEIVEVDDRMRRIRKMRKRASRWGDVVKESVRAGLAELLLITLTYRPGDEWQPGDLREYMLQVKKMLGSSLYGYFWVAELQKRGVVHYMPLLWVRKGVKLPMPDKSGMWRHGWSSIDLARGGVGYLMKYEQKLEQKTGDFPKGLRLFAGVVLKWAPVDTLRRLWYRLSTLPGFILTEYEGELLAAGEWRAKRREGGGWMVNGHLVESPWRVWSIDWIKQ